MFAAVPVPALARQVDPEIGQQIVACVQQHAGPDALRFPRHVSEDKAEHCDLDGGPGVEMDQGEENGGQDDGRGGVLELLQGLQNEAAKQHLLAERRHDHCPGDDQRRLGSVFGFHQIFQLVLENVGHGEEQIQQAVQLIGQNHHSDAQEHAPKQHREPHTVDSETVGPGQSFGQDHDQRRQHDDQLLHQDQPVDGQKGAQALSHDNRQDGEQKKSPQVLGGHESRRFVIHAYPI